MARTTTATERTTRVTRRSTEIEDGPSRLYSTKNDLPQASRVQVIELLNQRLADSIDLQTQCKQAHWNVKGPAFIALHKLFDEINEDVEEYVRSDCRAHRAARRHRRGNRGRGDGTHQLVDYPLALSTGAEHVAALSDALAAFGRTVRVGIEEMNELEDAGSADILTEISRGVDKWLWFVEAHQQGG